MIHTRISRICKYTTFVVNKNKFIHETKTHRFKCHPRAFCLLFRPRVQKPGAAGLPRRSQRVPRGRRLLFGEQHIPVFSRSAGLSQQRPHPLAAGRCLPDTPLASRSDERGRQQRHLCAHHPLPQRTVLHDYDPVSLPQTLLRPHRRPRRRMVRTDFH